jgi:hypothetical protein
LWVRPGRVGVTFRPPVWPEVSVDSGNIIGVNVVCRTVTTRVRWIHYAGAGRYLSILFREQCDRGSPQQKDPMCPDVKLLRMVDRQ